LEGETNSDITFGLYLLIDIERELEYESPEEVIKGVAGFEPTAFAIKLRLPIISTRSLNLAPTINPRALNGKNEQKPLANSTTARSQKNPS
jgi:hypothetical protein